MAKILIFDFDGTIADTMTLVMDIANEIMPEIGRDPITDKDIEKLRKMTIPQGFKYLKVPFYKMPQLVLKARQKMKSRISELPLIDGIEPILRQLAASNVTMGIVTSNSAENVNSFLKKNKLNKLFSFVDAGSNPFSKSRNIKAALKHNGLDINNCIYIGDEIRDIQAARSIKLPIAVVPWGINHPETLKQKNPDYFISKPSQLIDIAMM